MTEDRRAALEKMRVGIQKRMRAVVKSQHAARKRWSGLLQEQTRRYLDKLRELDRSMVGLDRVLLGVEAGPRRPTREEEIRLLVKARNRTLRLLVKRSQEPALREKREARIRGQERHLADIFAAQLRVLRVAQLMQEPAARLQLADEHQMLARAQRE